MTNKPIINIIIACACTVMIPSLQMAHSEPFIGEVRWVGFNFCPVGWGAAEGQILSITSNEALFSLYGTQYGGDGRTTFALPDLRGRVAVGTGTGPGLTERRIGDKAGTEQESLSINQMPSHNHLMNISTSSNYSDGANTVLGSMSSTGGGKAIVCREDKNGDCKPTAMYVESLASSATLYDDALAATQTLASSAISSVGGSSAHNNMQPFLALKACVALVGIFPTRN